MSDSAQLRRRAGHVQDLALRHPLRSVAVFAAVVALSQLWWVARHRAIGGFDVDESGYLAMALRYHRLLLDDPVALVAAVRSTETAPLVPLLSGLALVAGPASTTVAFVALAALAVAAAVGTAGVTLRLAGPGPALVAGALGATLPVTIASGRLYQFSLGTAAFSVLAVFALLSSERCERRVPMLLAGAAVGLALLSRTMMVGLLPAFAAGTVLLSSRSRRAWTNTALSAGAAIAVAGPWYASSWRSVGAYLFRSGYGDRSGLWGESELLPRLALRGLLTTRDGRMVAVAGLVVAGVALWRWWSWHRGGRRWRDWPVVTRPIAACGLVVVLAYAALLSTPNTGSGFDLPVQLLLLATGVAVAARLVRPPRTAHRLAIAAIGVSVAWVPLSWIDDGTSPEDPVSAVAFALVGGIVEHQEDNLAAEPRFDSPDRRAAASEWAAVNDAVVDELAVLADRYGDTTATVTGAGHLLNVNTLALSAELGGAAPVTFDVPDTTAATPGLLQHLDPVTDRAAAGESRGAYRTAPSKRVLVVVRNRSMTFPDDSEWQRFVDLAERRGWRAGTPQPLPDGGEVTLWTHPANDRA